MVADSSRNPQPIPVQLATIVEVVRETYGISEIELFASRRRRHYSEARQVAMWLAGVLTTHATTVIGRRLGGRDHTTVIHGIRAVDRRRATDPAFHDHVEALRVATLAAEWSKEALRIETLPDRSLTAIANRALDQGADALSSIEIVRLAHAYLATTLETPDEH